MTLYEQNKSARELFYDGEIFTADAHGARVSREEQQLMEGLVSNYQQATRPASYGHVTAEVRREDGHLNLGRLHFNDPLVEGYAQVAYQRAADLLEAWRGGPDYPVTGGDWSKFPGVDPAGKFCSKDMELEYRLNRLDVAKEMVEPQRKELLSAALVTLRSPEGTAQEMLTGARTTFRNVREAQLAAMVCPDAATSRLLETKADQYLISDPNVTALDRYVTVLEQVAGLRKEPLSQELAATADIWSIDQSLLAVPPARTAPQTVSVGFASMDNVLKAGRFASAVNWGRTPQELVVSEERKKDFETTYEMGLLRSQLDSLYAGREDAPPTLQNQNRGTMITVGTKTVAQLMKEEYDSFQPPKGKEKPDFDSWYAKNLNTKTVDYLYFARENAVAKAKLAAANGTAVKAVEQVQLQVRVPTASGALSKPIQMTRKAYQPLGGNVREVTFDPQKLDQTKSLFEQYQDYREPLHKDERELLAAAQQQRKSGTVDRTARVDGETGKLVYADPVLNGYLKIAEARAEKILKRIDTPINANLHQKYPGVDPKDKYCEADMQLEQRINRIRAAASVATGVTADHVNDFLHAYDTDLGNVGYYKNQIKAESRKTRLYELGARVCPDAEVSRSMEAFAKQRRDQVPMEDLGRLLTVVEKVVGLNHEQLLDEEVALYNRDISKGYRLQIDTPVGNRCQLESPAELKLDLRDFKRVAWQCHNADPLNWVAPSPAPVADDPNSSRQMQSRFMAYGAAVASNALEGMFTSVENRYLNTAGVNDPDRGSLVIVGGKTIRERMQEHYNNLPNKSLPYDKWYHQNLPRMSGEILFAGLMNGMAVDAYVPDRWGKLPKEPTAITAQGYGPNRAKPVTMNTWERLFSKLGFYKEKAAQVKAQQEHLEARQRVRDTYEVSEIGQARPGGRPFNEAFFGEYMRREHIPDMHALNARQGPGSTYRMSRSAATTACVCMLAANGHSIRDIMDPTKLIREKQQAGEIYMERATMDPQTRQPAVNKEHRTGDARWLGSVFFHGQMALKQQFNTLMKGKDLSDPKQYQEVMPALTCLGDTLYDACQEVQEFPEVIEGHLLAAHQVVEHQSRMELSGQQLAFESAKLSEDMMTAANNIGAFSRYLMMGRASQTSLASPLVQNNPFLDTGNMLTAKYLIDRYQQEPNKPAYERVPHYTEASKLNFMLQFDDEVMGITDAIKQQPANWKEHGKLIMSGELANSFELKPELYGGNCGYSRYVLQLGADGKPVMGPDGKAIMEKNEIVLKTVEISSLQVTPSAQLQQKLGLAAPPAAQNQPRAMR